MVDNGPMLLAIFLPDNQRMDKSLISEINVTLTSTIETAPMTAMSIVSYRD